MTTAERLRGIIAELQGLVDELEPAARPESAAQTDPAVPVSHALRLNPEHWFSEPQEKDLIVLHFTAGSSAASAVSHWNSLAGQRVGTAYVVDLDGTIYETFDPRGWAYHLGIKSAHGDVHDRRSIGIEIVNVGPLRRVGDAMCWWPREWSTRYCAVEATHAYREAKYRGESAWANYTGEQYDALARLIPKLCREHQIPMVLPPEPLRGSSAPSGFFKEFRGIASHQNFRADKFDVGPAFDWGRLHGL